MKNAMVMMRKEVVVEKVRAYRGDDGLVAIEQDDFITAYRCPNCDDLHEDAEEAAECCESDWKVAK